MEVSTMNPRDHFTKINLFPWKITELKVTLEQTNLRVLWKRQRPILLKYCIAYFRSCGVLSKNCSFIYVKKIVHSHTLEYDGTVMSHGRRGRGEFWSRGHSSWRDNLGGERTCPKSFKILVIWHSVSCILWAFVTKKFSFEWISFPDKREEGGLRRSLP